MKRFAVVLLVICGCAEPASLMVHRPESPTVDAAVTKMWSHEIHGIARDGDWILTRSYYALADVISLASPGEPLSHASIYDAEHDTVIEAVGDGVREIPLSQLVDRNHYVIVVRPTGMTEADGRRAVSRARSKLGTEFDRAGMLGFDDEDKFYCSELVWWASQGEQRSGQHYVVVTPANLIDHGTVIYWSGKRTDEQVMQLAINR
jgi:Permuted papain-like amidase enzyme, YaeF/YiiX, C92 family